MKSRTVRIRATLRRSGWVSNHSDPSMSGNGVAIGNDLAKLSQVRPIGLEQHLRGFGMAQNSSERLVEFMSDR
jgi:hypothetical protein